MCTAINLKLSTNKEIFKAHFCTKFGWNLIKIYGVMINLLHKKSRLKDKPMEEIWHVDGLTSVKITQSNL